MTDSTARMTMVEAIRESIADACRYNPGEMVASAAVVWTDADNQWEPVIPELKKLIPGLFVLGEYNAEERTGPAIWLRCVIERTLPEVEWPEDSIPVIYLPGVSRQTLRAVEECPASLQPFVELQYRGTVWTQKNGKDWTVEAFLISNDGGLGLDVARDNQTRQSMLGALGQLAVTPIARLQGKRLEAEDFDKLMIEDTTRDLLLWLNDPGGVRAECDDAKWSAFRSRCKEEYGYDPEDDGELAGGENLGLQEGAWKSAWDRFKESPALYGDMPDLLRRAKPDKLVFDAEPWPDENEKAETALREALMGLGDVAPAEARTRIAEIESEHAVRRDWVWATLGWSVLAQAVGDLAALAESTKAHIGGDTPDAAAREYIESGYRADDAVLRALGRCKSIADTEAVATAARALYAEWLEGAAAHLQLLVSKAPFPCVGEGGAPAIVGEPGQCLLFVDGLRYDLGVRLAERADKLDFKVAQNWRWSALPSVTGTAKPAVSPAAPYLEGEEAAPDFVPELRDAGGALTADRFRKLLNKADYQVLGNTDTGSPAEGSRRAWCEYGEFDSLGHSLQTNMAARVEEQLDLVMDRIEELLNAGWESVRVITDHGWLMLPGGLPVEKLPGYLAKTRWSRCAVVKDSSHIEYPTSPWYWNKEKNVAYCRGSHAYFAGKNYAHGGISLQECVLPDILIGSGKGHRAAALSSVDVQWLGLRCRVSVEPATSGLMADIRTKANDAETSVTEARTTDGDGKVGLLVSDEELEGTSVSVVLLDAQGRMISKKPTIVGGEE